MRPYLKKKKSQKKAGGVAQSEGPEFKPQYHKKKKKSLSSTQGHLVIKRNDLCNRVNLDSDAHERSQTQKTSRCSTVYTNSRTGKSQTEKQVLVPPEVENGGQLPTGVCLAFGVMEYSGTK
jgi:hypothetical protein